MIVAEGQQDQPSVKRYMSKEILIEEQPPAAIGQQPHGSQQKVSSSGRTTKVKISSSKTKQNKGNNPSTAKSIKVPPPTINPYNTMSNLKTHNNNTVQRRDTQAIQSQPISKISMTSTQKLNKGTNGILINVDRPNSGGLNHNDRSSTSNSNYYN